MFIFEPLQIMNHNNIEYNISNHQNFKRRGYKITCKPMDFLCKIIPLPESWRPPWCITLYLIEGLHDAVRSYMRTIFVWRGLEKNNKSTPEVLIYFIKDFIKGFIISTECLYWYSCHSGCNLVYGMNSIKSNGTLSVFWSWSWMSFYVGLYHFCDVKGFGG